MKKILILGVHGMAGHVIKNMLCKSNDFEVYQCVRDKNIITSEYTYVVDVRNLQKLESTVLKINPDVIINCIGLLVKDSETHKDNAVYINSFLPHYLCNLADQLNAKLIHISTDCVFSGKKGQYKEDDLCDAEYHYGKTKALGEINQKKHLTIRTSIIGPELKISGVGLFNWFMSQKSNIKGYKKSLWSGVTTLELAKAVRWAIDNDVQGLYHLTNGLSISKFDLLSLFKKYAGKEIEIEKVDGCITNKSILDTRKELNYVIPEYEKMISDMILYIKNNKELYSQYFAEETCLC